MKELLVVVDMQNDFITGTLANPEGQKIVQKIADYVRDFNGDIIATRDTHNTNYMETQEGRKLPVLHCVVETDGWQIVPEIQKVLEEQAVKGNVRYIDKPVFGSVGLGDVVARKGYANVNLVGVCTDICVISNAMVIRACAPETEVTVLKDLCAGVTPESHENALKAMAACQVNVI